MIIGSRQRIVHPSAFMRGRPDASAEATNELLFGEEVTVIFSRADWAEVESITDQYRGFMPTEFLSEPGPIATHKLTALRTLIFSEPNLKAPVIGSLSFLSRVRPSGERNGFAEIGPGAWAFGGHLAPIADALETDHARTALRFREAPYLWGGRTSHGLDCSALVQLSLAAANITAPRDSGPQRHVLGHRVLGDAPPRWGDFAFWPGHVAIVVNDGMVVHANAHHMAVTVEPLAAVTQRVGMAPEVRRL
jgi:cell wall-associated NlpC family hydrolase